MKLLLGVALLAAQAFGLPTEDEDQWTGVNEIDVPKAESAVEDIFSAMGADRSNISRKFPEHFFFGVATSSVAIEGAWNISKGLSIWDLQARKPFTLKRTRGVLPDEACDSYHKYPRDVEMISQIKANVYRFSIAMPRILPTGFPDKPNQEAIDYYNNLIELLIENGITPIVTIFHYDLPVPLQDLGGFTNPLIEQWMTSYARILFNNFGDRVKYWLTLNEPFIQCFYAYGFKGPLFPPALNTTGIAEYMCLKNLLKTHASIYHLYDKEFRDSQQGFVSFPTNVQWAEPADPNSEDDIAAAESWIDFMINLINDPIYSQEGGWPVSVNTVIDRKSKEQGFDYSRLPELSQEEAEFIRGTYDYVGINFYYSYLLFRNQTTADAITQIPSVLDDVNASIEDAPSTISPSKGQPEHLRKTIKYFNNRYGVNDFIVSENGFATTDHTMDDDRRIISLRAHLNAILQLIHDDGINVFGYTFWSLMDSYDFGSGFTLSYGLFSTDFNSTEKTRTPKKSALAFRQIATDGAIDWNYNPSSPYVV